MSRLDWEAERRRQMVAATRGSSDGEGSRRDPTWEFREPRRPRVPSLFGLESAQAQLLSDKQVWALVDAGKHLSKAQAMLRARRVPKARKQAREAWKLTEPVVQKLRASRKRQQALVAERLIKPFTKLARQGVDVWVGRSGRDGTCPVCQLELSAADIAGRRLRHVECE